jgi:Xaa-Pro dipeptidase
VDLIRSFGKKVISSAQLVALFECVWSQRQISSHFQARDAIDAIMSATITEIGRRARDGGTNEHEVQEWVLEAFGREDLISDSPPMIAVNANSSKPHYSVSAENAAAIREGDFVLLDFWGKKKQPDSVYYDISWAVFVGESVPDQIGRIFDVVRRSRDQAIKKVQTSIHKRQRIRGWEVDKAARDVLDGAGLGQFLSNRVGHSIGTEVHGNGTNIDNFESFDDRELLPNTCFSIEPGVYLPEFGLRSEVNLLIRNDSAEVTGRIQNEMVLV